jgi:hypothetical protein
MWRGVDLRQRLYVPVWIVRGKGVADELFRLEWQLDLSTGDITRAIWTERLVGRREVLRRGSDGFWREIAQWLRRKGPPAPSADSIVTMSELP